MSGTDLPEKATITLYIIYSHKVTHRLGKMQGRKLLMVLGRSLSECGRECVAFVFGPVGSQYLIYGCLQSIPT